MSVTLEMYVDQIVSNYLPNLPSCLITAAFEDPTDEDIVPMVLEYIQPLFHLAAGSFKNTNDEIVFCEPMPELYAILQEFWNNVPDFLKNSVCSDTESADVPCPEYTSSSYTDYELACEQEAAAYEFVCAQESEAYEYHDTVYYAEDQSSTNDSEDYSPMDVDSDADSDFDAYNDLFMYTSMCNDMPMNQYMPAMAYY